MGENPTGSPQHQRRTAGLSLCSVNKTRIGDSQGVQPLERLFGSFLCVQKGTVKEVRQEGGSEQNLEIARMMPSAFLTGDEYFQ